MEFLFSSGIHAIIKNFTVSSAVAAETFFAGIRERKKLDS